MVVSKDHVPEGALIAERPVELDHVLSGDCCLAWTTSLTTMRPAQFLKNLWQVVRFMWGRPASSVPCESLFSMGGRLPMVLAWSLC